MASKTIQLIELVLTKCGKKDEIEEVIEELKEAGLVKDNLKLKVKKSCDKNTNIINKGTGAGGNNTNANGLPYEKLTDLKSEYEIIKNDIYDKTIKFNNSNKIFMSSSQANVFKCMEKNIDTSIISAHGCKRPDECFISEEENKIFIIEKKFQQCSGSVCEKIQTSDFKKWQYNRVFPDYEIFYIYCLSDWFKTNTPAEIEYLKHKNVPVFWGSDTNYKTKIIDFIINA